WFGPFIATWQTGRLSGRSFLHHRRRLELGLRAPDGDSKHQAARRAFNRTANQFVGDTQLTLALGAIENDFWHDSSTANAWEQAPAMRGCRAVTATLILYSLKLPVSFGSYGKQVREQAQMLITLGQRLESQRSLSSIANAARQPFLR